MRENNEQLFIKLRGRIYKSPNFIWSSLVVIAVILVFFYFSHIYIIKVLLLLMTPFFFTILLDILFIKIYKVYFPINRIGLLNEITFLVCFSIFIITIILSTDLEFSVLFSFSITAFIRFIFYSPFLDIKNLKYTLIPYNYVLAMTIVYLINGITLKYILPFLVSGAVFLITAKLFLEYLIRDFVKEYHTNPLDYVGSFVNYLSTQSPEELLSLNRIMQKMYSLKDVPLTLIAFKAQQRVKALFVFPYIHPGPFGDAGCSNFQIKLKKMLSDITDAVFIFHTTTTHDDNCGGIDDIKNINNAIHQMVKSIVYKEKASPMIIVNNKIKYQAQLFGEALFFSLAPEKLGFDDINFDLGMKLIRKLKRKNVKDVVIVDEHNSFDPDYSSLDSITNEELSFIKAQTHTIEAEHDLYLGTAQKSINLKSLGPLGVSVAITKINNNFTGYVLLDGNNMIKGLRETITIKTKNKLDNVLIATTDNHIVNLTDKDLNPVGNYDEADTITSIILELIDQAMDDLERVRVGSATTRLRIHVAGKGYIEKTAEITQKILKKAKSAFMFAVVGIVFSIWIFIIFKVL